MYVHSMPLAMLSKSIVCEVMKGMYVDVIKEKIGNTHEKVDELTIQKIRNRIMLCNLKLLAMYTVIKSLIM